MRIFYLILIITFTINVNGQVKPDWLWGNNLGNNYKIDTTYKEKNAYKYIPVMKDSIFPNEYIIVTYSNTLIRKREFLKKAKETSEISEFLSMSFGDFIKKIGDGESVQNKFFEFSLYSDDWLWGQFGYLRKCYIPFNRKKGYTYNIHYVCIINKKTRFFKLIYSLDKQIKHFEKKRNSFVNLLDYKSKY